MARGLSQEQKNLIIDKAKAGMAISAIARELNSTFTTVKKVLEGASIVVGKGRPARGSSRALDIDPNDPAIRIAQKRKVIRGLEEAIQKSQEDIATYQRQITRIKEELRDLMSAFVAEYGNEGDKAKK